MIELATGNRWAQTYYGKRNHARTASGRVLCGLPQGCSYPADPNAAACARCVDMAGPAMPPPPGGWPAGKSAFLASQQRGRAAVDGLPGTPEPRPVNA